VRLNKLSSLLTLSLAMAAVCGLNLLTGCAAGTAATGVDQVTEQTTAGISGVVHGGQNPIGGSSLTLWQTTTGGYGAAATSLNTTSTLANGSFNFPAKTYSCPPGAYDYITASGGDPSGTTTNDTNTGILLVAMLGSCTGIGGSTDISINEVTTVAAAYALSGFALDSGGTVQIGTTTTNTQGLSDAAANAALLANFTYGTANVSTSTLLLPTAMLNTLANSLAACVNTASTSSSLSTACLNLYNYTTPPNTSTKPADTFQAALNMAHYPGSNVTNIVGLGSSFGAFQPTVASGNGSTTAQNDLTLGIEIPNPTQEGAATAPVGIAVDNTDDVWIVGGIGTADNYITETTSSSAGLATTNATVSSLPTTDTLRYGAFDTSGNLWMSLKSKTGAGVVELSATGISPSGTYTLDTYNASTTTPAGDADLDQNTYYVAIDGSNNIWTASYGAQGNCTAAGTLVSATNCEIVEFPGAAPATPVYTFGSNSLGPVTAPTVRGAAADASSNTSYAGNVWFANDGITNATTGATATAGTTVQIFTPGSSTTAASVNNVTVTGASGITAVALDSASGAWVTGTASNTLVHVSASGGTVAAATAATASGVASATSTPETASTPAAIGGLNAPTYDAVDGAGNVWVLNPGYNTVVEYSPSYSSNAGGYLSPLYGFSPTLPVVGIYQYTVSTAGQAEFYGPNNLVAGDTVVLSGFTTSTGTFLNGQTVTVLSSPASTTNHFYANVTGYNTTTAVGKTADTGVGTIPTGGLFTCSGSTTVTCGLVDEPMNGASSIAIDRAGSVWVLGGNGALTEIIGTAAPTNPVLAKGQYGVEP
jgi:hypothetical protein